MPPANRLFSMMLHDPIPALTCSQTFLIPASPHNCPPTLKAVLWIRTQILVHLPLHCLGLPRTRHWQCDSAQRINTRDEPITRVEISDTLDVSSFIFTHRRCKRVIRYDLPSYIFLSHLPEDEDSDTTTASRVNSKAKITTFTMAQDASPQPGMLYVTMKPNPELSQDQFHDWYNNEHGPMRLRFPFFRNGFRYRATDLANPATKEAPEWLAWYDVTDMAEMTKEPYTALRQPPIQSQRERDTMKQIKVDRKFFDFVYSRQSEDFCELEKVSHEGEKNVLVSVFQDLYTGDGLEGREQELQKWYEEEHIPMLSKIQGWRRTRLFVTATIENKEKEKYEYVAIHEYAPENGLDGPAYQAAISTPWRNQVQKEIIKEKRRRTYELYYTIGPAQRELRHIYEPIISTDGKIKEFPATATSTAAIESYITTSDGVELPYRLEGSTDPQAPLIVLSNSILTHWAIWDGFVTEFLKKDGNKKYRIVRYLTRGRSAKCGDEKITVDLLGRDVIALLDALRVPQAEAVIGVSLGGATALNVALNYPERVKSFIACDTSAASPAGNAKAWGERIHMAEATGASNSEGDRIVGDDLAEATTRRWFVPENYEDPAMAAKFESVKEMVGNNSLEGFAKSVEALWEYDMSGKLEGCRVKAGIFVGAKDGALPASMEKLAGQIQGAKFVKIENAGHLPMVEQPEVVAEEVTKFLKQ